MNSRERMLAAIDRKSVDRIPTDIWATPEIRAKLRAHFGKTDADIEAELHIDGFAGASPKYIGPTLPAVPANEKVNFWGIRYQQVSFADGCYDEQVFCPLAEAETIDDLNRYNWPRADWFDCSGMAGKLREARKNKAIQVGYMAPLLYHNYLRGLEQSLLDPLLDPEFTHYLVGRISDFIYAQHRRIFEACDGLIDVAQVTDDLGSQNGPLLSLEMYREFYAPQHKRLIDLCREFGIRVFHHDCGSCRAFLPLLVEMGIDILNPIQQACPGMNPAELKAEFGDRICFHGAVENQKILPFGTPAEVRAEIRHCIDTLAADGTGYILASCHSLQANTPVENIIAMYDEAWKYGRVS